jgi:hypothetical protein
MCRKVVNERKAVKEGYGGRRFTKEGGSFYGEFNFLEGSLGFAQSEESLSSVVGLDQYRGAPVCWRFWAWGPGYPYDILARKLS